MSVKYYTEDEALEAAGVEPFTMPWRCRLGWHKWGRWSDPYREGKFDICVHQVSKCLHCRRRRYTSTLI